MRGLKIKNGVIENIAIFDKLPAGWSTVPNNAGIGWSDNGDGTFSEPVITISLEEAKSARIQHINGQRNNAINGGVIYDGNTYDTDDQSRKNLTSIYAGITNSYTLPTGFMWRTTDDIDIPFSTSEINGLSHAVLDHVNTQYRISWTLKDAINAATTVIDVNLITWPK